MASGLLGDGTSKSVVDIHSLMDSDIPKQIAELVQMGVLVSIGTTRDRGALSLTVTHNGDWDREYFRDSTDAADWLRGAIAILASRGLGDPGTDLPATQKPTRTRRLPR